MNPKEPAPNNPSDAAPYRAESLARIRGTSRGERWFRSLVQYSSDVVMILETDGTVRYVSPAVERVLGYRPEDFAGSLALDYVHPEDVEYMSESFAETLEKPGVHPPIEYRARTADGSWRHMEAIRSNWLSDPHIAGVVANIRDVTERKKAEEALKEGEERYRAVMEQSVETIYLYDAKTKRVLESNSAFRRMMGYTEEELLGMEIYDFIAHDRENIDANIERSLREKRRHIGERRYRRKDGSIIVVDTSASVISYDGRTALCAVSRDVTERKRAEEALKESEERFRSLLQNASDMITILGADGTIHYDSPAIERILGYRTEERIGKSGFDYVHPEDLELAKRSFTETVDRPGVHSPVEFRLRHKDGSWCRMEVTRSNLLDDPTVRGVVANFHDITERKEGEDALRQSEERYRAVIEQTIEGIYLGAADTKRVLESNAAFQKMLGYTAEELRKMHIYDFVAHDRENIDSVFQSILDRGHRFIGERRYRRKDGSVVDVETSATVISYDQREVLCTVVRDVTERKRAEEALKESEERFRGAFNDAPVGVALVGLDGHYLKVNRALCEMLGYSEQELLVKTTTEVTHPNDWEAGKEHTRRVLEGGVGSSYHLEKRYVHADGRTVWALSSVSLVRDPQGNPSHFVSLYQDITERKALEEQLRHRAFHDPLTELPNRALFLDRLGHALARSERLEESLAVLFVDLDNFKVVNDSLGHQAGDHLLNEVAERLQACIRTGDTVARPFGDEFAVLLEAPIGEDDIRLVTERVQESLQEPFHIDGREVFVSASIGIATGEPDRDADKERPESLLRRADLAMYVAKRRGKNRYDVFNPSMDNRVRERMELENALRRAIEREEFEVRYEPIIALKSGRIEGLEALARWRHPERGLVVAEEFIPLAEETGLIRPIGRWVFEEACGQARRCNESCPDDPLLMSVNFSVSQFAHQADLIPKVLSDIGLNPRVLTIEITERAVMDDADFALGELRRLKDLGVSFAIDDYGTGYSCLRYLKLMPVECLKIDRSFVAGLGKDLGDEAIVAGTIDLAHALGLKVVAEGVETAEQLERLKHLKCDLAQGFYFSQPLAGGEIQSFLTGDHRRKPKA